MTSPARRLPARGLSERWLRTRDIAIVAVIVLLLIPRVVAAHDSAAARDVALSLLLAVPLLWRRQHPVVVFGVIAAFAAGQWVTVPVVLGDLALLVSFYTVAARCTTRTVLAAAAVLEFGVVLAVGRDAPPHADRLVSFLLLSGLVVAAGVLGANVRVRAAYLAAVEQRAARLELERDQQRQLATAEERARIARELHDIVAHNLSVMIALSDGASFAMRSDPEQAAGAVGRVSEIGRNALSELRRVVGVMREDDDDPTLAPAPAIADLDQLVTSVRATGLSVRYSCTGDTSSLAPGLQLVIYRVVQEAVTNTLKHAAGVTGITIAVRSVADEVTVLALDDGTPRPIAPGDGVGHGLIGMRERVSTYGGRVDAGPTARGWLVRAGFALEPAGRLLATAGSAVP